jgi:hypothetical protein
VRRFSVPRRIFQPEPGRPPGLVYGCRFGPGAVLPALGEALLPELGRVVWFQNLSRLVALVRVGAAAAEGRREREMVLISHCGMAPEAWTVARFGAVSGRGVQAPRVERPAASRVMAAVWALVSRRRVRETPAFEPGRDGCPPRGF